MSNEHTFSVMAATKAITKPGLNTIEVQLATTGGPLQLLMTPRTLGQILSGLTELETEVQTQTASTTGHFATQVTAVQELHVDSTAAGEKIAVSFRNSKGRFQSFALSLEQAQELRVATKKAEERARKLASSARN